MRDHPNAIILFAAGFGTRMGPLTKTRPKPLVKVAGRALIDHALSQTNQISDLRKVVNCHYFSDQIKAHLSNKTDISIVVEADEILETGGGLKNALPLLGDGPVFTMNTDAVWSGPNPLNALLAAWNPDKMDALLLCVPKKNAVGHKGQGDFIFNKENQISYGPGDVYTGLQIVKTDRLRDITETSFSLKLLWEKLLDDKKMFGLHFGGKWCDVGTPEGVVLAEDMLGYVSV